jgi:NHL repeat-containing protein
VCSYHRDHEDFCWLLHVKIFVITGYHLPIYQNGLLVPVPRPFLVSWGMASLPRFAVALLACVVLTVAGAPAAFAARDPLGSAPGYQRSFGEHELAGPSGVTVAASGDIWVADTGHNRVVEFSGDGRYLTAFSGSLDEPEGVAVDASGDVWVASTGSGRVVEFSASGSVLARFGALGSGQGQLSQPVALAVAAGVVYVADQDNNRIEKFSTAGAYRGAISVATPAGVALDGKGDIWVSSPSYAEGNTIDEFSAAGKEDLRRAAGLRLGYRLRQERRFLHRVRPALGCLAEPAVPRGHCQRGRARRRQRYRPYCGGPSAPPTRTGCTCGPG